MAATGAAVAGVVVEAVGAAAVVAGDLAVAEAAVPAVAGRRSEAGKNKNFHSEELGE